MTWNIALFFSTPEGGRQLLQEGELEAPTRKEAKRLAMDRWWDSRLDSSGCSPSFEIERLK